LTNEFAGAVVAITGGGRGIGRAIAEAFAQRGAKVMIGARTLAYGENAAAAIRAAGGEAEVLENDISTREGCDALVARTTDAFGGLDILVHSAAEIPDGGVDASDEAIRRGFESIVMAGFWLTRAARPHLKHSKRGGRMIFITSVAGTKTVVPGRVAYGVCKSALESFVRGVALELAEDAITVNAIAPGLVASARPLAAMGRAALDAIAAGTPAGRPGTPEEVAHAALFLAGVEASFITGHSVVMDGGATLAKHSSAHLLVDHQKRG